MPDWKRDFFELVTYILSFCLVSPITISLFVIVKNDGKATIKGKPPSTF